MQMPITLEELKEKLKSWDEVILLDALGLTSEDLLDRFDDIVEQKYDQLIAEYIEDENDTTPY